MEKALKKRFRTGYRTGYRTGITLVSHWGSHRVLPVAYLRREAVKNAVLWLYFW